MHPTKILLTSFQTWLPHQKSNASDDLLGMLEGWRLEGVELQFLRQLPVNTRQASEKAIAHLKTHRPNGVICCGMAETRQKLTVESNARKETQQLHTKLPLNLLVSSLSYTEISHDAGQFVCEGLYYELLSYCQHQGDQLPCLFVHVPILTPHNQQVILQDFQNIINFIVCFPKSNTENARIPSKRSLYNFAEISH